MELEKSKEEKVQVADHCVYFLKNQISQHLSFYKRYYKKDPLHTFLHEPL